MKKLFCTMAVAAALFAGYNTYTTQNKNVVVGVALANVEALAENGDINPACPNGCFDNGDGCYCYYYFPYYKEAGKN